MVLSSAALLARRPTGNESDSSGTLGFGVIPSCNGDSGDRCVRDICVLNCDDRSCVMYTNDDGGDCVGNGAVNPAVLSNIPFSASSIDSRLLAPAR